MNLANLKFFAEEVPYLDEVSIGHALISDALYFGLENTIQMYFSQTGMKLNYKVLGEGEPVIVLHGLLGMLDNWQAPARLLQDSFQVFLVDLRNHGHSPHSEEHNYSADDE